MNQSEMSPFFIIGTERSGTNLLRVILNSHPDIFIPHPPHIFKNFHPLLPLYGSLDNENNFLYLIEDVIKSIRYHHYPWDINFNANEILSKASDKSLMSILFYVYNEFLLKEKKKIWGCKSTFMIHHVKEVLDYCPNAKFIYLVRDGRDVAVSAKKSIFNHFNTYYIAKLWCQEQEIGIFWLNHLSPHQIILIKYEDLLAYPEKMIKEVCDFLDVTYYPLMLNFYQTEEAKKGASINKSWQNTKKNIIKDNFNKFLSSLSKKDILIFESIASKQISHFNYQLVNDAKDLLTSAYFKKREFFYRISDIFLKFKEESKSFFRDKNNSLRYKKSLFLKMIKMKKKIHHLFFYERS